MLFMSLFTGLIAMFAWMSAVATFVMRHIEGGSNWNAVAAIGLFAAGMAGIITFGVRFVQRGEP